MTGSEWSRKRKETSPGTERPEESWVPSGTELSTIPPTARGTVRTEVPIPPVPVVLPGLSSGSSLSVQVLRRVPVRALVLHGKDPIAQEVFIIGLVGRKDVVERTFVYAQ